MLFCILLPVRGERAGDVIKGIDKDGNVVVKYTYDAWGKIEKVADANGADLSSSPTHIANVNPIRYRSYYYDTETQLYYLQSRYYDPETCRFINADDAELILAKQINRCNLFVYSVNNPINYSELEGQYAVALSVSLTSTLAAKFTALCASIKAMVSSFWNIFIIVGLVIAVALIVYSINKTAKQVLKK